jgi:hypothetical protein
MNDMLRKPTLFIIGAMKSGTSSLHAWLGSHVEIFMCEPKEPCYFVDRADLNWPYIEKQGFWRSEGAYLALFKNSGNARILGESSTLYTKAPRISYVPARIAKFSRDAKLIYLMRDPVERTVSHYWHMVRHHGEHRSLQRAIRETPDYCDVSHYAYQLRPYLERFGPHRVLTLTFEDLIRDPQRRLHQIFQWLGVESSFVPANLSSRENATPEEVTQVRGRGLLNRFRHSRVWCAVGPRVPRVVRCMGRSLSERTVERDIHAPADVLSWLRPIQQDQTEALKELLKRDFPEWRTLYGVGCDDSPLPSTRIARTSDHPIQQIADACESQR